MRHLVTAILAACALLATGSGMAQQRATAPEAVALVKRAVAHIRQRGLDSALKDFNDAKGGFVERDLYIVVLDMQGRNLAHGANPRIVGKDLADFKDVDGKAFVREELQLARTAGTGWVDFKFVNPANGKVEAKSQYLERAGDVVVMSGIYKHP